MPISYHIECRINQDTRKQNVNVLLSSDSPSESLSPALKEYILLTTTTSRPYTTHLALTP